MSYALSYMFEAASVRVTGNTESPLFCAADVCAVLGIANSRDALAILDNDEKVLTTTQTPGGPQQMTCVTESGLYHLIFKSRKPAAKRFRRWVTEEVLPSIRRNGAAPSAASLTDELAKLQIRVKEGEGIIAAGHLKVKEGEALIAEGKRIIKDVNQERNEMVNTIYKRVPMWHPAISSMRLTPKVNPKVKKP